MCRVYFCDVYKQLRRCVTAVCARSSRWRKRGYVLRKHTPYDSRVMIDDETICTGICAPLSRVASYISSAHLTFCGLLDCYSSGHRDGPSVLTAQTSPEMSAAECPLVKEVLRPYCVASTVSRARSCTVAAGAAAGPCAASVASSARSALATGDAFGHIRNVVRSEAAAARLLRLERGRRSQPLTPHVDPMTHCARIS